MKRVMYVYYGTLGIAGGYIDGIVRAARAVEGLDCYCAVSAYYRFPSHGARVLRVFFPLSESTPENPFQPLRLPNVVRLPIRYLELCAAYVLLAGYVLLRRIEIVNVSLTDDYLVTSVFIGLLKKLGVSVHVTAHDSTPYGRVVRGRRARLYAAADRVVVHYGHVRDCLISQYGVAAPKIEVLPYPGAEAGSILNPRMYETFAVEARRQLAGAERVFLFIGILRPEKGLGDLLEAWRLGRPEPDDRVRLVVAGKPVGQGALAGEHRRDIVFVKHYLASEEFQAWLDLADVVALPYAVDWYAHSAVLIMAALASKPVVASDIPLFAHLVSERTGWLFKAGDVKSLSEVLERIAREPADVLRAKGAAAREAVLESWRHLPGDLVGLYDLAPCRFPSAVEHHL